MSPETLLLIQSFILGGIVVAGATFLANHMSTRAAGVFWSLPLLIIPSLYFVYKLAANKKKGDPNKITKDFMAHVAIAYLVLLVFSVAVILALRGGMSFVPAILVGLVAWLVSSVAVLLFVCPSVWKGSPFKCFSIND